MGSSATRKYGGLQQHDSMTGRKSISNGPKRRRLDAYGLLVASGLMTPVVSQGQLSVMQMEVNGGASVPVAEFAAVDGWEGEASTDASFGVHFVLTSGHLGYVVGFSEHRFKCLEAECGAQTDLVSTAWDLGVRLNLRTSGVVPWLRLGVVAALLEADLGTAGSAGATVREESDRGWGFEAGAGILIPLAARFGLSPGVRYGRVDLDLASKGVLRERYLVVDLGLVLGF